MQLPSKADKRKYITLKLLFERAKITRYLEHAPKCKVSIQDLMLSDSKEFADICLKMDMKPGHKLRLKRVLSAVREEGFYTEVPELSRASSELKFISQISSKIKYQEFARCVNSVEVKEVSRFLQQYKTETKAIRHLIKERFKLQTHQNLRGLRKEDVDTLLWIQKLYAKETTETDPRKVQPLPFSRTRENFVRHLFMVEQSVRGMKEIWAYDNSTPIIFGFISRHEATKLLKGAQPGTFIFRLSNSVPSKIVICARGQGRITNKIVNAFTSIEDFKQFYKINAELMIYLRDNDTSDIIRLDSILKEIEGSVYQEALKSSYFQIKKLYGLR